MNLSPTEQHIYDTFLLNDKRLTRKQIEESLLAFRNGKTGRHCKVIMHYMKAKLKSEYSIKYNHFDGLYTLAQVEEKDAA